MSIQLLRGKRLRLTRLDECGAPLASSEPCAFTVTKGFISVSMSPEYEDGDEFVEKNANGEIYLNEKEQKELKRYMVSIEMCGVDFSVAEVTTGDRLELDWDGNPVGLRSIRGRPTSNFALELWTGIGGQQCDAAGNLMYGYFLLPFVNGGKIAEISVENGPINVSVEDAFTKDNPQWGVGPWDVIDTDGTPTPGPLSVPVALDEHRVMRTTIIAPPAATDGCEDMPA